MSQAPTNAFQGACAGSPRGLAVEIRALSFTINAEMGGRYGRYGAFALLFTDCWDYMTNLPMWNRVRSEARPNNGLRSLMFSSPRAALLAFAALAATSLAAVRANAESVILVDVDSGKVLHAENATDSVVPGLRHQDHDDLRDAAGH